MSRLMDLVVLVTELIQENEKTYKEIDQELIHRGYSSDEIEQARFWMAANAGGAGVALRKSQNVVRVLSRWEQMSLGSEASGYLLRILNLGIIDLEQFEQIMTRIIPVGPEKIPLSEVKAIASAIVFDPFGKELESELFDDIDDEIPSS